MNQQNLTNWFSLDIHAIQQSAGKGSNLKATGIFIENLN